MEALVIELLGASLLSAEEVADYADVSLGTLGALSAERENLRAPTYERASTTSGTRKRSVGEVRS